MNLLKLQKQFSVLTLLWVPVLTVLLNVTFFWEQYFFRFHLFLSATAITFSILIFLSYTHIKLSVRLRKKYPRFDQRKNRLARWLFISIPIMLLVILALWILYTLLPYFDNQLHKESFGWALLVGTVCNIIAIIINEGQFTYQQWKEAIIEAEQLQKINWQSRYEGLKQQVNPHFLFNSINTLSSLIYEDKAEAGRYVKEMSQVYRYLLRSNDDELVPLKTELQFIHSYYHLLKTRFGAAIHLQVDVPQPVYTCLLPPLTLQMLVENAVKHNHVSKESPLQIHINCTEEGWLSVNNNRQRKQGPIDSTGIGLNNIREKYRLLGLPDVQLQTNVHEFRVVIPLVEQHGKQG